MKIMVCYDGGDGSQWALKMAIRNAKVFDAELYLVASLEKGTDAEQPLIDHLESELSKAKEKLAQQGLSCTTHLLVRGLTPGEDLVAYAKENDIDQIVIGIRRKSKVGKLIFGSTAQYLILKAPCPVLTVNRSY
ncbi:MAG: universal stress protein [Thermodesulfobacteriota bacterium]